jgi:hypothetical protein
MFKDNFISHIVISTVVQVGFIGTERSSEGIPTGKSHPRDSAIFSTMISLDSTQKARDSVRNDIGIVYNCLC